jgi:4-amino-4-deoxy-L-arabinose transferase-like glycosyltransferase
VNVAAAFARFWRASANEDRYPAADHGTELAGRVMTIAAIVWMFLVAVWGIAGPFSDGHVAATAGIGTGAWNMLANHLRYPVLWTPASRAAAETYLHHPLGVYWSAAIGIKIFGEHNWVLRLPAVAASTLTPLLLARTARAVWGPLEGGLAAIAYVSLPITLGFSNFHALEGPVILGLAVALWGYVRYLQTWRERYAAASVAGYLWALNHDWPAYMWGVCFATLLFARLFVCSERLGGPVWLRGAGRYWAALVAATAISLAVMAYFVFDSGKLHDLLTAYVNRSGGNQAPLAKVLQQRHVWIELMFPGLAIALGKLALPVMLARTVIRRSWNELVVPLPLLVMASLQYVYFKQGADVHIFWPQYFAPFFALGIAVLAATVRQLAVAAAPRLEGWLEARGRGWGWLRWLRRVAPWTGLALVALPLALVFRDGASMIRLARETGGRFNSPSIQSDVDKAVALRWYLQRYPREIPLGFHPGMIVHWALAWEAGNRQIVRGAGVGTRGSHASRLYMIDASQITVDELRTALANFRVTAVGTYWFLDREGPAGLDGFSFREREPSLGEWLVRGGTEPTRTIVPDPWVEWEWRSLLGRGAFPPQGSAPATFEQLRIAHNAAVTAGEQATANRLEKQLVAGLELPVKATWNNGTTLLGAHHHRGAQRSLTLLFRAGSFPGRAKFSVTAKVLRRRRLSTLALDSAAIETAPSPSPATDLWRAGHLYAVRVPYRKRPGTERYEGRFVTLDRNPAPARTDQPGDVLLLTLP